MPFPTTDPKELGELIKAGRTARGWSQRKLAAKIGAAQASIYQLEKGNRALGQPKLEEIFRAFDESPLDELTTIQVGKLSAQTPVSTSLGMCPDPDCYGALPVQLGTAVGVIPLVVVGRQRCPICTSQLIHTTDCKHPIVANELLCPKCEAPWFEDLHIDIELSTEQRGPLALQKVVEDMIQHRKMQLRRMHKTHLVPWAQL